MIKGLPDGPVKLSQLKKIEENVVHFNLVRPGTVAFGEASPFDEEATEEIIIIATKWFGALDRSTGEWEVNFRETRQLDEDDELLYMVALERLGLV